MARLSKVNHTQNIMTIAVVMFLAVIAGGVIMIANNTSTPKLTNKAAELTGKMALGTDKLSPEVPAVSPTPPITNTIPMTWYGSYFNDTTAGQRWNPANLVHSTNPEAFQYIDFDWSTVKPFADLRVPYSVSWWGNTPNLQAGNYRFCMRHDDGMSVWIQAGPHNPKNHAPLIRIYEVNGSAGGFVCTTPVGQSGQWKDMNLAGGYNITVQYYEDPAVYAFGGFYFAKL
jgi:hypothetical protein